MRPREEQQGGGPTPDEAEHWPEDLQPGDPGYLTLEELLDTLPGSEGWGV